MSTDTRDHEYRSFLEDQELTTLRDWALHLARKRRDVGFLWDLSKHLPDTEDANTDWAAVDPVDAVRELVHLVTHFREEAASPEIGDLLKARYVEYLADHADHQRFDTGRAG
ncbi:MAG TPA: hypothetical protein VFA45_23030 [Actinomycetes bacterium]|jgi:hypothetical protein|nr:hypothetical protein [Actinomycetes bacterium]